MDSKSLHVMNLLLLDSITNRSENQVRECVRGVVMLLDAKAGELGYWEVVVLVAAGPECCRWTTQ
jgi:hypothetical protein